MNRFLEKLAFTKTITNFIGNVSGARVADSARKISTIESFVANNRIGGKAGRALKGMHAQHKLLERAKDKARMAAGIAGGTAVGGAALLGGASYKIAKNKADQEQQQLYSALMGKQAGLASKDLLGVGADLGRKAVSKAFSGVQAVTKGVYNIAHHATGGKLADYAISKGLPINTMGHEKFKAAVKAGRPAEKLTSLVSRYGDKNTISSLLETKREIGTLQKKKTGARIGISLAAGAGIAKLMKSDKNSSATRQYYY